MHGRTTTLNRLAFYTFIISNVKNTAFVGNAISLTDAQKTCVLFPVDMEQDKYVSIYLLTYMRVFLFGLLLQLPIFWIKPDKLHLGGKRGCSRGSM